MKITALAMATALLISYQAQAATTCAQIHDQSLQMLSSARPLQAQHEILVAKEQTANLLKLFREYGITKKSSAPAVGIELLFQKLNKGLTSENAFERSEKMSVFGNEVLKLLPSLSREQRKGIEFLLVEAVSKLESFRTSEVINKPDVVFARHPQFNYFPMREFTKVTKSYIDQSPFYSQLQSHTGVLDWGDIRDIFSNDTWIVEIKNHDTYHLFYSTGHPYYLASVFRTAWSRSADRYFLTSSLFEGIDNFQTGLESAIFHYMSQKPEMMVDGKMDLEAAVMYLARAPKSEIDQIGDQLNIKSNYQLTPFYTWLPKLIGQGKSQATRDAEINDYIAEIIEFTKNPAHEPYTIYKHHSVNLH